MSCKTQGNVFIVALFAVDEVNLLSGFAFVTNGTTKIVWVFVYTKEGVLFGWIANLLRGT